MKKFILQDPPDSRGMVYLKHNDFHYLVRIRRLEKGSFFKAFLPDGSEKELEILSIKNELIKAQCRGEIPLQIKNTLPPVFLLQALPKGAKMDLIVRQSSECGISRIIPFFSEYSQVKNNVKGAYTEKIKRWNRIIREARQQSGSVIQTQINTPCNFDDVLLFWEQLKKENSLGIGFFFHEQSNKPDTFHNCLFDDPGFVVMAIGPEGGFSPMEAECFNAAGFKSIVLGDNILRTETAALYGAAAIRTILLERAYWQKK